MRRVAAQRRYHAYRGRWEVEFIAGLQNKFTKPIAGKRRWVFRFIGKHRRAGQTNMKNETSSSTAPAWGVVAAFAAVYVILGLLVEPSGAVGIAAALEYGCNGSCSGRSSQAGTSPQNCSPASPEARGADRAG